MADVTKLLVEVENGDRRAASQLLPIVYTELRRLAAQRLAREQVGQTLTATALVHEAFLRLVKADDLPKWETRGHFFSAAAEAMQRILIENARRKGRIRHGGNHKRIDLNCFEPTCCPENQAHPCELIELDAALREFSEEYSSPAKLVQLRFFAGLSMSDSAEILGISRRTAQRYWAFSKAWLFDRLRSKE